MSGKKPLILALVVLNAALLGLLVVMHADRSAQAQVIPEAVGRFAVISQTVETNASLLWVLDTATRRMIVYYTDKQDGRTRDLQRWDLTRVFRFREAPPPSDRGEKPPKQP